MKGTPARNGVTPIADYQQKLAYQREWLRECRGAWLARQVCCKCGGKDNLTVRTHKGHKKATWNRGGLSHRNNDVICASCWRGRVRPPRNYRGRTRRPHPCQSCGATIRGLRRLCEACGGVPFRERVRTPRKASAPKPRAIAELVRAVVPMPRVVPDGECPRCGKPLPFNSKVCERCVKAALKDFVA